MQLFYSKSLDIESTSYTLPKDESKHIIRVLRKQPGDTIYLTNGRGYLFTAQVYDANPNKCKLSITSHTYQEPRDYKLHLAVAPTKLNDRFEWFLEKTTENDLIVVVADATNLKRNLLLFSQIVDLKKQVILVLNMMDLLEQNKQEINISKLSKTLNCPVVPINAKLNKGINQLKEEINNYTYQQSSFLEENSSNTIDETMLRVKKNNKIVDAVFTKKGETVIESCALQEFSSVTISFTFLVL